MFGLMMGHMTNTIRLTKTETAMLVRLVSTGLVDHTPGTMRSIGARRFPPHSGARDTKILNRLEDLGLATISRNNVRTADARYTEMLARPTLAAHTVAAMVAS